MLLRKGGHMADIELIKSLDTGNDLDWKIITAQPSVREIVLSGSQYTAVYGGTYTFSDTGVAGTIQDLRISRGGDLVLEGKALNVQVSDVLKIIEAGGGQREILEFVLRDGDYVGGSSGGDRIATISGADRVFAGGGNDIIDGGSGSDTAIYRGAKVEYSITRNEDGSYTVTDKTANRDGTDTLANVEQLQFSDQVFSLSNDLSFPALFTANLSQAKAISAAYQTLLGGIPGTSGFEFLINANLSTNFGAEHGPVFNDENIYINILNALIQGNPAAEAKFNSLASGQTLSEQIASLYEAIIPAGRQTAEGLAFLTRDEGLHFYEEVAAARGITSENGPAIVAMASLLKVAVDSQIGIGNPIGDLFAAIADGSSTLPATSSVLLPIEAVDGTKLDGDDDADVMPGFWGPSNPPMPLIGVEAMLWTETAAF